MNIQSYRCTMTYNSKNYVDVITVEDKSDPYVSEMLSIGGFTVKNNLGGLVPYVIVRTNQREVDPLKGNISETAPASPAAGDFWYQIDHTGHTVTLMKYSSSAWAAATETQELTYIWYAQDKDGNPVTFDKTGNIIQVLHSARIADTQETAVGLDQFVPDGVQRDGEVYAAVRNIVVVIRHGHVADYKPLFLLDRVVMDGDEQFEQSAQGAFVIIGRLDAVLQIGKAGLACPGMGVVKIRTVIQRPPLEYHGIALFTDNGGCQRTDSGQVRMVERRGKRHAVDVLRVLLNPGGRG